MEPQNRRPTRPGTGHILGGDSHGHGAHAQARAVAAGGGGGSHKPFRWLEYAPNIRAFGSPAECHWTRTVNKPVMITGIQVLAPAGKVFPMLGSEAGIRLFDGMPPLACASSQILANVADGDGNNYLGMDTFFHRFAISVDGQVYFNEYAEYAYFEASPILFRVDENKTLSIDAYLRNGSELQDSATYAVDATPGILVEVEGWEI